MKQNKFDISFQIGPWNLESLICNTHMCTRVRACTYTQVHTHKEVQTKGLGMAAGCGSW